MFPDDPRNRKRMLPAAFYRGVYILLLNIRQAGPGDQQGPAAFIRKGLRSVKIKPLVPFPEILQPAARPEISVYLKITCRIDILEFVFIPGKPLGGKGEEPFSPCAKQIRHSHI